MKPSNKYREFFDTETLRDGLKKRSIRGGLFTIGGSGITFALRLGATAILARTLIPEDFGLIGMVTAITVIAENFKDFGLSTATIQQKNITHEQISNLFWINALVGVAIMTIIGGLSFAIARFYNEPRLTWIALALSTSFFWGGITIQHQAILTRKMQFGALAVINITMNLLSTALAVVLAIEGYGVWALVWREISRGVLYAVCVWLACPWLPGLPSRNSGIGSMIKTGGDVTAFNMIVYFTDNLDFVLMGKYFGADMLGLYKQGTQLALLPVGFLSDPVQTIGTPALRMLLDDVRRYREYYKKSLRLLTFVNMPLMAFLFIYAYDIIELLFGQRWIKAVVFFQIFALAGFIRPASSTAAMIMISCAKTRRYLVIGIVNSLAIIVGICLGFYFGGAVGIGAGHVLVNYLLFIPVAYAAFKATPIGIGLFLSAITPSLICSLSMGLVLTLFSFVNPIHGSFYSLLVSFLLGSFVYLASWMIMPGGKAKLTDMFADALSMVRPASDVKAQGGT